MARIVFAAGVPHAPAIVGLFDSAPDAVRQVVSDSFAATRRRLLAARPDVLIVFANDHLTNSRISAYPDFIIAAAPGHSGPHEWFKAWIGCRDWAVRGDPAVGKALFRGMTLRGVRMNLRTDPVHFDDNLSVPTVMMDLDEAPFTVVPVLQNCTVPPFPDGPRCYEIGQAVAAFIRDDLPPEMRVALIGSGGLSHEPGGAKYYKIDEDFDRRWLALCTARDHGALLREITVARMDEAGAGGTSELLAWFIVMGAIGERAGESFGYSGWTQLRCGVGAVIWEV
jgi:hypothetical protein